MPGSQTGSPDPKALVSLDNKENNVLVVQGTEVVVKSKGMDDAMFQDFVFVAIETLEKFKSQQEQATHIKQHFDSTHGPVWHCIVGRSFGSFVTHEEKGFAYVYIGGNAVLLFKSG